MLELAFKVKRQPGIRKTDIYNSKVKQEIYKLKSAKMEQYNIPKKTRQSYKRHCTACFHTDSKINNNFITTLSTGNSNSIELLLKIFMTGKNNNKLLVKENSQLPFYTKSPICCYKMTPLPELKES